jgi:hypothetical protein
MKDDRDLLEVLKFELEFLEKGGYGRSPRQAWRAPLIIEDSPTCLNYALGVKEHPCADCILMALVPEQDRERQAPCNHIRLNESGETIGTLYRSASQPEMEETFRAWLKTTIARLESEREQKQQRSPAGSPGSH